MTGKNDPTGRFHGGIDQSTDGHQDAASGKSAGHHRIYLEALDDGVDRHSGNREHHQRKNEPVIGIAGLALRNGIQVSQINAKFFLGAALVFHPLVAMLAVENHEIPFFTIQPILLFQLQVDDSDLDLFFIGEVGDVFIGTKDYVFHLSIAHDG